MAPDAQPPPPTTTAPPTPLAKWLRRVEHIENTLETRVWPWAVLPCTIAVLMALALPLTWLGVGGDPFNDLAFDAATWRSSDGTAIDCPRGQMLANLEDQYLHAGMPRAELIELLGPPDAANRREFASWYVGCWSGFRFDLDSIDLSFDANGQLESWQRQTHPH